MLVSFDEGVGAGCTVELILLAKFSTLPELGTVGA